MERKQLKYARILLKLTGESLGDDRSGKIFSIEALSSLAKDIAHVYQHGAQIAIVVGGGNIIR